MAQPLTPDAFIAELFDDLVQEGWVTVNGAIATTSPKNDVLRETKKSARKVPALRRGFLKREKALSTRLVAAIDAMHAKMLDKARLVNLIESAVELREDWVTINGAHVLIGGDGTATAGPAGLVAAVNSSQSQDWPILGSYRGFKKSDAYPSIDDVRAVSQFTDIKFDATSFHGSTQPNEVINNGFDAHKTTSAMFGPGVYFTTDKSVALGYASQGEQSHGAVLSAHISANLASMTKDGWDRLNSDFITRSGSSSDSRKGGLIMNYLMDKGYDGLHITGMSDGSNWVVLGRPSTTIRSIKVQESLREAKKPPKIVKPADVAAVVDSAAFAYELEDALAEEMTIGYGEAIGELGLGLGFDVLPKDALKYLSTHIDEFAASVAQGEREGVLTFIRSALTDGVGAHELGAQLKDYFAEGVHRVGADGTTQFVEDTASWSDTVARTELSRAYNDGKRELYASAGYSKWQFVAAEDELMCGECEGLDGEVVEIGEPFSSGDDAPPIHPNCVVAGTRIATDDATVGLCRWFEGSIIRIVTKLGHELTGTPDHPIATRRGWVALGAIHKGDEILSSTRAEWALASNPDDGEMPPVIEKITEALAMVFRGMPISTENLDGNVIDRKVDVVNPDRLLSGNDDATLAQHRLQQHFRRRFIPLSDLDGLRPSLSLTNGGFATAGSVIRRLGDLVLLLRSSFGLLDLRRREVTANQRVIVDKNASDYRAADLEVDRERILRFSSTITAKQIDFVENVPTVGTIDTTRRAMITNGNSSGHESPEYGIDADAEGFCDEILRLASDIALDEVCFVEINPFAGHVYNLTTKSGWYVANGIVTHNCRCTTVADPDAMDTINADRADAGDESDAG